MKVLAVVLAILGVTTLVAAVKSMNYTSPIIVEPTNVGTQRPPLPVVTRNHKQVQTVELSEENAVLITGEINQEALLSAEEIIKKSRSGIKELYVVINSPGGSVMDGAQVVSAIQASPVPVVTICAQFCASMASIIFESGTKRLMVDRAFLMFHDAAGGVQGTFPQIKNRFEFFSRYVSKMDYEMATKSGMTLEQFMSHLNPEWWVDAEDAHAAKLSDGYVSLTLSMSAPQVENILHSQTATLNEHFNIQLGDYVK